MLKTSQVTLTKQNRNKELSRIFDLSTYPATALKDWMHHQFLCLYYDRCDLFRENGENFTKFEYYLLNRISSYNIGLKMMELGFYIEFSGYKLFDYCNYYFNHNLKQVCLEATLTKSSINKTIKTVYQIGFNEYHHVSIAENYNNQLGKEKTVYLCLLYQFIKWLEEKEKIVIIDKDDFIMFYDPNKEKFHLERNSGNDVEWTPEYFDEAITRIFEEIL